MIEPFRIVRPAVVSPLLVEIPHAGVWLPPEVERDFTAAAAERERDADRFVDELYAHAAEVGATLLIAQWSRYYVDLNRAATEVDAKSVASAPLGHSAPRGVIWRLAGNGVPLLRAPLAQAQFELRLARCYERYHAQLALEIAQIRGKFGHCLVLAAHSMPSRGTAAEQFARRADLVPGSRGATSCEPSYLRATEAVARGAGWSLRHDEPYRGGHTTRHYGDPARGVSVLQIELSRRLYLDESSYTKLTPGFERTREVCTRLVEQLRSAADAHRPA